MGSESKAPAEFADVVDLRLDATVIETWIKFEDDLCVTSFALDLPNELVFGPKSFSFVLFRCDRHEIGQNNFARVIREDRFENIRLVDVTPGSF